MDTAILVAGITAVTTSLLGPLTVHYVTKMMAPKKPDTLSDALEVNRIITDKLDQVKTLVEADRIWLLQFHNGGNFYPTGKSIQKFSMVYELLNNDVVPCQSQFQNIPVSLFSKQINALHKGEIISVKDATVGNSHYDGFTSVISGSGVKSTYVFPIYNIKGDFVGIVGLDYHDVKTDIVTVKLTDIELEVSTIGGVLGNFLSK
jgi:hypothetical protein